jgi:putative transposase
VAFSRVSVHARRAFPVRVEQVVRSAAEQAARKANAAAQQQHPSTPVRRPGRPQGSRSTPHAAGPRTPAWARLTARRDAVLQLSASVIPVTSVVLDGHFGHHKALQLARPSRLHLLSQLRCDAAVSCPDAEP